MKLSNVAVATVIFRRLAALATKNGDVVQGGGIEQLAKR
jgi:hypothetical protein